MNRRKTLRVLLAALAASGAMAASGAYGDEAASSITSQVNIAGATLFKGFFPTLASTNDAVLGLYDGDTGFSYDPNTGLGNQPGTSPGQYTIQLAPTAYWNGNTLEIPSIPGTTTNAPWLVSYSATGSGGGLADLMYSWQNGNTMNNSPMNQAVGLQPITDSSYINGLQFGSANGYTIAGQNIPTNTDPINPNSIDIATTDVRLQWLTQGPSGTGAWNAKPTTAGYGQNPATQLHATASEGIGDNSTLFYKNNLQLQTLAPGLTLSPGTATSQSAASIYQTPVAWVPIAFTANPGTGIGTHVDNTGNANVGTTMTNLQFMFVTGRDQNGKNLIVSTREFNSGTRNGAMNSIGVDPSWGRGDYVGPQIDPPGLIADPYSGTVDRSVLGATHEVANMGGTSLTQGVVKNNRLGIGYMGLDSASKGTAPTQYNILSVEKDISGATSYVHPTVQNIFQNGNINTGYQIGGSETFSTIGDPTQPIGSATGMANTPDSIAAQQYIENIMGSIAAYSSPGGISNPANNYMPGQYLNYNFVLNNAVSALPGLSDPLSFSANSSLNSMLQSDGMAHFAYSIPNSDQAGAGVVPTRMTGSGITYSDGVVNGNNYINQNGAAVNYGAPLDKRNWVSGDFSGDGKCDLNDAPDMMKAMAQRLGGTAWVAPNGVAPDGTATSGGNAVIEILGDFTGTGSFDPSQARYWADGLAMDPTSGKLNRGAGFQAIDANWTASLASSLPTGQQAAHPVGNFFDTAIYVGNKANGVSVPYVANSGASRADIATPIAGTNTPDLTKMTPGGAPTGSKGYVDATDINYIKMNFGSYTNGVSGAIVTSPTYLPVGSSTPVANPLYNQPMDLSADMNGDLTVDYKDVYDVVHNVMRAIPGDLTLQGSVTSTDLNILLAHFGQTWAGTRATYTEGDINGDGVVNSTDLNMLLSDFGATGILANGTKQYGAGGLGYDASNSGLAPAMQSGSLAVVATPEPASLVLLGLGSVLVIRRRRRA